MKKIIITGLLLLSIVFAHAQPAKKPATQKQPTSNPDMNKLLEEVMKNEGMSKEEQEEIKKMMKGVMPALEEVNSKIADYPEFTNNNQLVPKKDIARIAAMNKKTLAKSEIAAYANGLYNKMLAKGDASEMAIVKKSCWTNTICFCHRFSSNPCNAARASAGSIGIKYKSSSY